MRTHSIAETSFPSLLAKEHFHAAGWLGKDEHLPFALADHGEGMRNVPRGERRVSRTELEQLIPDFCQELTAQDTEPLVLGMVAMKGGRLWWIARRQRHRLRRTDLAPGLGFFSASSRARREAGPVDSSDLRLAADEDASLSA